MTEARPVRAAHHRDLSGYGRDVPDVRWPNGAGLALNFVLNVEEGAEYGLDDGDGRTESALIEVRAPRVPPGSRDLAAESMYEYGSRVGFWRIHDAFRSRGLPLTIFASALALERTPKVAAAIAETDWDVCAHGWRWVEHYLLDRETERAHIDKAYTSIRSTIGRPPQGWYCRYAPSEATRGLLVEHGGFLYDSDAYNDEVPYWVDVDGTSHLVVPYTMTNNDAKFMSGDLFSGAEFGAFLKDGFDLLVAESASRPKTMSVGLHSRVVGHPGRMAGLLAFLDHVSGRDDVWVCGRAALADHWRTAAPADRAPA